MCACGRRRGKAGGERLRRRSSPAGPQSRVSGHGWGRGGRQRDARGLARLAGTAATAKVRRGDQSTRWRGFGASVNSCELTRTTRCRGTTTSNTGGVPYLLARLLGGFTAAKERRRQRNPEAAAAAARVSAAQVAAAHGQDGSGEGRPGGGAA
jgi:hypothetical protein